MCGDKIFTYFCTRKTANGLSLTGCSAVRLAHLLWEQGVEGSNPFTPTFLRTNNYCNVVLCIYMQQLFVSFSFKIRKLLLRWCAERTAR